MEEHREYEDSDVRSLHMDSEKCECAECQNRRKYVQIIDVDRYVDTLNDWD